MQCPHGSSMGGLSCVDCGGAAGSRAAGRAVSSHVCPAAALAGRHGRAGARRHAAAAHTRARHAARRAARTWSRLTGQAKIEWNTNSRPRGTCGGDHRWRQVGHRAVGGAGRTARQRPAPSPAAAAAGIIAVSSSGGRHHRRQQQQQPAQHGTQAAASPPPAAAPRRPPGRPPAAQGRAGVTSSQGQGDGWAGRWVGGWREAAAGG